MQSGYYLVMNNGKLFGPIVCDSPRKDTYLDHSVQKKAEEWSGKLKQEWKFIS